MKAITEEAVEEAVDRAMSAVGVTRVYRAMELIELHLAIYDEALNDKFAEWRDEFIASKFEPIRDWLIKYARTVAVRAGHLYVDYAAI